MRILVVEDTESVRFLLERYFESLGHHVVALASGLDVPKQLDQASFDAVFTDVTMPECSGWDVLLAVRAARPELPVVLITGWVDEGRGSRGGHKPDAVLDKPFTLDQIRDVLEAVTRPR